MKTCQCDYCQRAREQLIELNKTDKIKISLQQEFEATCLMYEHIDSELKKAVDKYNNGNQLSDDQKALLARAIWRC